MTWCFGNGIAVQAERKPQTHSPALGLSEVQSLSSEGKLLFAPEKGVSVGAPPSLILAFCFFFYSTCYPALPSWVHPEEQ